MTCLKCIRGLHPLCSDGGCETCHSQPLTVEYSKSHVNTQTGEVHYEVQEFEMEYDPVGEELSDDFRTGKLDSAMKDQQSTGRKRAAKLYPLDREAPCEWRGIEFPGGSKFPLRDCVTGLQQARHHGPDYNTLNNDPGNVHRICHFHHNNWHAANDILKDEAYLKMYGHKVNKMNLSQTAKDLRSGKIK